MSLGDQGLGRGLLARTGIKLANVKGGAGEKKGLGPRIYGQVERGYCSLGKVRCGTQPL